MTQNKIKTISELGEILNKLRGKGKKIVHCHGVFDLLHIGHIRYFEQACKLGNILVVTLTPDRFVDKGPHRPAFNETLRAEALASLGVIDYVAINEWSTAENTLRVLKPSFYVKGAEFKKLVDPTGKIQEEAKAVSEIGGRLIFTDDIIFSSSNLINKYLSDFPEEISSYLELFRNRYQPTDLIQVLDRMSELKVLVIGDTILDEYQYCEALGKSSKDPTLALKYQNHDLFAGGVLAVANHVANFAGQVTLLSVLGDQNSHDQFIAKQLNPKIKSHFHVKPKAPTLIKRRFVDGYSFNKLFEVYVMDDSELPHEKDQQVCQWLNDHLNEFDLVLVADFGHGTVSNAMVEVLTEKSPFLAVNTQANAGNRGFHTISRYKHADYVCIAGHEMRLEYRNASGELRPLMTKLTNKIECSKCVVTRGRRGCSVLSKDGEYVEVPTFVRDVVDRVGAGDAFLSVTSLAAVQKVDCELLGFLGNVVGSLAVQVLGNKKSINRADVDKFITSLLK